MRLLYLPFSVWVILLSITLANRFMLLQMAGFPSLLWLNNIPMLYIYVCVCVLYIYMLYICYIYMLYIYMLYMCYICYIYIYYIYIYIYIYNIFFIHLPVDGHLGCFPVLDIANNAEAYIRVQIYLR